MNALRPALILLVVATMPSAAFGDGDPQPAVSPSVSSPPAVLPEAPDRATMQSMELRMRAQMETVRAQIETVRAQMRASQFGLRRDVLAVLTPQQRAFVATTIGELAVTVQRDDAAAAERIDAALSPAQRQAVLRIVSTNRLRRAAEFQNLVQQNHLLPEHLPASAQYAPTQPSPQELEAHANAGPIAAGVGSLYGLYGAAGQTSAGGAILSVLEMPVPQFFAPSIIVGQPH
jgi:hypothetical protein